MQTHISPRWRLSGGILFSWSLIAFAQSVSVPPGSPAVPAAGAAQSLTAVERGPQHTVWEYTRPMKWVDGQMTNVLQRYVQLESGLNYQDAQGQWQESGNEIELVPGGAQFVRGQQQVMFAADLDQVGAVQLRTPDGLLLKTRILGLAYYDPESDQSVLIAELQSSPGELLTNHQQILYPNAFKDIAADVCYTVTRSTFEQDIILREQPPAPADFGLSSNAILQVLTEFFDPPTPAEEIQAAAMADQMAATNHLASGAVTPPPIGDHLSFGNLSVVPGRAFLLEDKDPGVPIIRTWKQLEGRQFLIESVPLDLLQGQLDQLPPRAAQAGTEHGQGPEEIRASLPAVVQTADGRYKANASGEPVCVGPAGAGLGLQHDKWISNQLHLPRRHHLLRDRGVVSVRRDDDRRRHGGEIRACQQRLVSGFRHHCVSDGLLHAGHSYGQGR